MNKGTHPLHRILAGLLALVLCLGLLPVGVFAAEPDPAEKENPLSTAATAFIQAVADIDRQPLLDAMQHWGAAKLALDAAPQDAAAIAEFDAANAAYTNAMNTVYTVMDLYDAVPAEELSDPQVEAANQTLTAFVLELMAAKDAASTPPVPPADEATDLEPPTETDTLYDGLPDAPTGSYTDEKGNEVITGETKISISGWKSALLAGDAEGRLDIEALNTADATLTVAKQPGQAYAIVPILAQVEYPARDGSTQVALPANAELLSYTSTLGDLKPATEAERSHILRESFEGKSASSTGFFVKASEDFAITYTYTDSEKTITKTLTVTVVDTGDNTGLQSLPAAPEPGIAPQAVDGPAPPFTTGVITRVAKVSGTWVLFFNGMEAYCCSNGLTGQATGCPTYSFSYCSLITADQLGADQGETQIKIWGGLNQLSLDPEAGIEPFATVTGYYTWIFTPPLADWQVVAIIGPPTDEPSITPDVPQEFYASWEAPPQTASGSFDLTYDIQTDKIGTDTKEKIDGAAIEIEPVTKSGSIDGGSWSITPAAKQTVTTTGHTMDEDFHKNGGGAFASWSLHYTVSKTSGSCSGREGPYSSREAADAAADSARNAAVQALVAEAQGMVNAAIAAAKAELTTLDFRYQEISIPYGFEYSFAGTGSSQTIAVPADTRQDYTMLNDEWYLQVNIRKLDSETGKQIAADTLFEVYEWDKVTGQYIPAGGYNQYFVERQGDGTYAVINRSDYAISYRVQHNLYYTQRNEGKFILVESKAPAGYFGDWTDLVSPGVSGTPLGKRAYYIEITAENSGSVIWLDNASYNADIATEYTGGTKLLTSGGITTTVTVYSEARPADCSYITDYSGTAANEDGYAMHPQDGAMLNDRVLGEISISKVDLDAVRYLESDGHGNAALDGAVYDLYAAEDIHHPDGVTGIVDYAAITYADGTPIWHTTVRDNSGNWVSDYLPRLHKDHLVASAAITDGWLTFGNLYLGKYYIVERCTGVTIPVTDGAFVLSGTYPTIDPVTKTPTGKVKALEKNSEGQYTDWVYRNQFSNISSGKAPDGTRTWDGYYISHAKGYLTDEHNYYITPSYCGEAFYLEKVTFADDRQGLAGKLDAASYPVSCHLHRSNPLAESDDQIAKGNVELSKIVSSSGSSNGIELENAGFTFYLISDLSKAADFVTNADGSYKLDSILAAYIDTEYDKDHPKYDFSGESDAIARCYEISTAEITAYNRSLTAAGDWRNGRGDGWVATGNANEYRLAEIFSNDTGTIRVQGLPYGQYLCVETTVPKDLYQAEPFIVTVDPDMDGNPQSAFAAPKDAVLTPSDSYQKFTVLNEEIEVYLRVIKLDAETGKRVLLAGTAFQIYKLDDEGNYLLDEQGDPILVTMADTESGALAKDVDTFYTTDEGILTLPEQLPLGHYRLVEVIGPNGYFNEWAANKAYCVDFDVTTDRIYKATGEDSENGQDILVIEESYTNRETLGLLTIRKKGEVLTGWAEDLTSGKVDPQYSGEAIPGDFTWELRPLGGAEFTITAAEDIYTQDRQLNADGSRTLWYAKGDVVAVVTTGYGYEDEVRFAPGRTEATYDFLSVIHTGTTGEVSITLPLGSYTVLETKAPYGFVLSQQEYTVTFGWNNQLNDVVLCKSITDHGGKLPGTLNFAVTNATDAHAALLEQQVLQFTNARERAKITVLKTDQHTGETLAGAVFNLYTKDDIYSVAGKLIYAADSLIATSNVTGEDGIATFDVDVPICGAAYNLDERMSAYNSGRYYIRELHPPEGYYLSEEEMQMIFESTGQALQQMSAACTNRPTEVRISKQDITNGEELPGATLTIKDTDSNVVQEWVSGQEPVSVYGLHFGKEYTLIETNAAPGYDYAEDILFKLLPYTVEDDSYPSEAEVYVYLDGDWQPVEDGILVMRDAPLPPPDPTPPSAPPISMPPDTRDRSNLALLGIVLGAAIAGICVLMLFACLKVNKRDDRDK